MEDKIIIAYSIALYGVIDKILYINGSERVENPVERDLAFNVKYKLQRNLDILLKDYAYYQSKRSDLIKKYGEAEKDNPGKITVTPDNMDKFKSEILESVNVEVSHSFKKLTAEEVNSIKDDINITANEMQLFIAYLVEDPDLANELKVDTKDSEQVEQTTKIEEK